MLLGHAIHGRTNELHHAAQGGYDRVFVFYCEKGVLIRLHSVHRPVVFRFIVRTDSLTVCGAADR